MRGERGRASGRERTNTLVALWYPHYMNERITGAIFGNAREGIVHQFTEVTDLISQKNYG